MTSQNHFGCICIGWGVVAGVQSYCIFQSFRAFFLCFFFNKPTARTARSISVVNGSNNVVPCKVGPFGVQIHIQRSCGGHFPQNPPFFAHFWQIATVRKLHARTAIQTKPLDQISCSWTQITFYEIRYDLHTILFGFPN